MTAALPMGGQKITGMADPTVATDGATKNYVDTATAAFFGTGDVKLTLKTAADTGWLLFDDGTFGSGSSGSSNRANADTQALFTLFFNAMGDAAAPLLTSGGGATTRAGQGTASSAWAANCRMTLPKTLGRALGVAGAGGGLTSRALGSIVGEETHLLTTSEMPAHNHGITDPGHAHTEKAHSGGGGAASGVKIETAVDLTSALTNTLTDTATTGITVNNNGGGAAHNTMQPTVFLNAMVKL